MQVQKSYIFLKETPPEDFGRWIKHAIPVQFMLQLCPLRHFKHIKILVFPLSPFWHRFPIFDYQIQTWGFLWLFHSAWPQHIVRVAFRLNSHIKRFKKKSTYSLYACQIEPLHWKIYKKKSILNNCQADPPTEVEYGFCGEINTNS